MNRRLWTALELARDKFTNVYASKTGFKIEHRSQSHVMVRDDTASCATRTNSAERIENGTRTYSGNFNVRTNWSLLYFRSKWTKISKHAMTALGRQERTLHVFAGIKTSVSLILLEVLTDHRLNGLKTLLDNPGGERRQKHATNLSVTLS